MLINRLSNRAFAWLIAAIICAALTIALIVRSWDELGSIARFIGYGIAVLAIAGVVYCVYRVFDDIHTRRIKRAHLQAARQHEVWKETQELLHRQQLEHKANELELSRLQLEQIREQNAHERLMVAASWQTQHMLIPEGQTAVFADPAQGGYLPIHNPRQLATPSERIEDTKKSVEIDERPVPAPIDVYTLLRTRQWTPDKLQMLLAVGPDGPVSVDYALAWHIALAGSTGGGKTNELRLILAQMVLFYDVYYISPAFAPVKANREDWRQIQARLKGSVARKGDEIEARFTWAIKELKRRQDAEYQGDHSWKGHKIYLVIDEYKEVIARYEGAPDDVSKLLRQARQYDIFVVVAAQDFLIKSIGGDSGARDCYRTALYFGGDPNTCRALLDIKGTLPYEEDLGKSGHMVLRTKSTKVSQARAPFMSNRAIYTMLGWPDDPILDDAPVTAIPDNVVDSIYPGTQNHQPHNARQTDDLAFDYRPLRPDGESDEGTFSTYKETRSDGQEYPLQGKESYQDCAQNNALESPVESTQEDAIKYKLDADQIKIFCAIYPVLGNIDKSLDAAKANSSYRQHARFLIEQNGLKKG